MLIAAVSAAITLALGTMLATIASSTAQAPDSSGSTAPGTPAAPSTGVALPAALADIPSDYLQLYQQAAQTCPGLSWAVLAGIGKIESNHGRSTLPGVAPGTVNAAGAGGPMQFLAPTFAAVIATHAIPPGGANPPSLYNPHDAIYAAADYLCDNGARNGANINAALWTYNHSQTYINQVLAQANQYYRAAVAAQPPPRTAPNPATPEQDPTRTTDGQSATVRAVLGFARVCQENGVTDLC